MKIFHTSDWHLGDVLYRFDRTEEQGTAGIHREPV